MGPIRNVIALLMLMGFTTSCPANEMNQLLATGKTLEIKASITPHIRKFDNGKSKIEGKITITNQTQLVQKFGNEFLTLIVNGTLVARAYKDTIASDVIDFSTVDIKPRSSLSLPVYWVYSVPASTKIDSVQLVLDEEGLEKVMHRITTGGSR